MTVTRREGKRWPEARIADLTLSRASRTAASGRPTKEKSCLPCETCTSTRTGLGSTPTRAADVTAASAAYQRADVGLLVPPVTSDEYIPALLAAAREHTVRLIVPTTDLDLLSLARARESFADLDCALHVPPAEVVAWCRDKSASMAPIVYIRNKDTKQYNKNYPTKSLPVYCFT